MCHHTFASNKRFWPTLMLYIYLLQGRVRFLVFQANNSPMLSKNGVRMELRFSLFPEILSFFLLQQQSKAGGGSRSSVWSVAEREFSVVSVTDV